MREIDPTGAMGGAYSSKTTPLTIDVHSHHFNGSDLQVKAFFEHILFPDQPNLRGLGSVLQTVGWEVAPSAKKELETLRRLSAPNKGDDFDSIYTQHRSEQYLAGRHELQNALSRARSLQSDADSLEAAKQIEELPNSVAAYESATRLSLDSDIGKITIRNAISFILRTFQYRYVNFVDYLKEYSAKSDRKIDLLVSHLVDYDWPISDGKQALSTLPEQVQVMEQLSIFAKGRIQFFVPFCPMKAVAHKLGLFKDYAPLDLVKDAIANRGFIGVKLYPPMGFAPSGNTQFDGRDFWNRDWIPPALRLADLGHRMDEALAELYDTCKQHNIPIMAHTAASNAPCPEFAALTSAAYWTGVPDGVRIDFGHFGEALEGKNGIARALDFSRLMTAGAASHGQYYFADAGFFVESVSSPLKLEKSLQDLYSTPSPPRVAAVAQRLMFGTDWEMIVIEGPETSRYLSSFEKIFSDLEHLTGDKKLGAGFFAGNAIQFLDLRGSTGDGTRNRLERFYKLKKIDEPIWVKKVDGWPVS